MAAEEAKIAEQMDEDEEVREIIVCLPFLPTSVNNHLSSHRRSLMLMTSS